MSNQQVKIYAKETDFQNDHLEMQKNGYDLISISSNVKLGIDKTGGMIARVGAWLSQMRSTASGFASGGTHPCRIIVVYERQGMYDKVRY